MPPGGASNRRDALGTSRVHAAGCFVGRLSVRLEATRGIDTRTAARGWARPCHAVPDASATPSERTQPMPARPWPLATTLAAVALTTTSCVAGPTITDEKKPAAATAPTSLATTPFGSAPQSFPNIAPQASGAAPGASAPPANTPPPHPTFAIGGRTPFVFADGSQVQVDQVKVDGPISGDPKQRVRVVVRVSIRNGTDRPLWAYRLDVQLRACAQPAPRCEKDKTAASATAEAAKNVPQGQAMTVDWFFAAGPETPTAVTVEVADPRSVRAEFTGTAT